MQMKKLNRVRLLNWMYFSYETLPINQGSVLISGENAAGKSTVLDAIQMVLTGNSTKFNKAANENSDRDLKSYVRCKIDTTDKTYLREGNVISNIALEFYEEKEKRWFVTGVHITSGNENDSPTKRWYIENGKLDDFSFLTEENKPSMPEEFRPVALSYRELRWQCDCSEPRLEKVLMSIGKKDLTEIIEEDGEAELVCQFCLKKYHFDKEHLLKILEEIQ